MKRKERIKTISIKRLAWSRIFFSCFFSWTNTLGSIPVCLCQAWRGLRIPFHNQRKLPCASLSLPFYDFNSFCLFCAKIASCTTQLCQASETYKTCRRNDDEADSGLYWLLDAFSDGTTKKGLSCERAHTQKHEERRRNMCRRQALLQKTANSSNNGPISQPETRRTQRRRQRRTEPARTRQSGFVPRATNYSPWLIHWKLHLTLQINGPNPIWTLIQPDFQHGLLQLQITSDLTSEKRKRLWKAMMQRVFQHTWISSVRSARKWQDSNSKM